MDYAKLALLKAEELERRGMPVGMADIRRAGLIFEKTLQAGEDFKICTINGQSEAGLIVWLQFSAGGGSVDFRLDKKTIFSRPYTQNMLFMASVQLSGKTTISIKANSQLSLVSADIMIMGGEIINAAAQGIKIAQHDEYTAAAYVSDGRVMLSLSQGIPDLSKYTIVGFGENASVAGLTYDGQPCFAVCYSGQDNIAYLTLASVAGQIICCCTLPFKAESVALIGQDSRIVAGYIYKGVAYAAIIAPPDFLPEFTTRLEEASSVEFVRGNAPPAVILGKKNRSVIRTAQPEVSGGDAVSVVFEC